MAGNAVSRGVPRRLLQGDGPVVPAIGAGQIPTINYSAGSARALQQFSRDLFSISGQMEDQLDRSAEAEAKSRGAIAGATGNFELQDYGTIRGRAFNQAAVETFAATMDTNSIVKLNELQNKFWNDPDRLSAEWSAYQDGVASQLASRDPAQAAAFRQRATIRGLPAVEAAKDSVFKLTRSEADAKLIENEAAVRAEIKSRAGDLFSENPERSGAAARSIQMLRNDFMRIYNAADPATGKPLYSPEEKAKAAKQFQDVTMSNAVLSWFDEQPDKAGAYMRYLSGDFKFKLATGGGYEGRLPAGMRNNNPGNIKYVGQANALGPSKNTDQGDPQAVYATAEDGMSAMYDLLRRKYTGGKVTPNQMIADKGGWTPGNYEAAKNVARYAGIGPNDDINLGDPNSAFKFMRALMLQEHGEASKMYSDDMIVKAINGGSGGDPATGTDLRGLDKVGNYEFSVLDALSPAARESLDSEMRQRITFQNSQVDRAQQQEKKAVEEAQAKNSFEFTSRIYAAGATDPNSGQPIKPLTREEVVAAERRGLLKPNDAEGILKALATEQPEVSDDTTYRDIQRRIYAGEDVYSMIISAGSKLSRKDSAELLAKNQSVVKNNNGEFSKDQQFYFDTLKMRLGQSGLMDRFDQGKQDRAAAAFDEYRRRVLDPENKDNPADIADDIASRATADGVAMDNSKLSRLVQPRFSVAKPEAPNRLDIVASKNALIAAKNSNQITAGQFEIEARRLVEWAKLQEQVEKQDAARKPKGK